MEEMMPNEKPKGRGGMTVDSRGSERILAYWPTEPGFDDRSSTSYIGRAFRLYSDAMAIAQRRHEQNRSVIMSKLSRQPAKIPEPDVRAKIARSEQKRLAELKVQLQEISDAAFLQGQMRRDLDPSGSSRQPAVCCNRRRCSDEPVSTRSAAW
jgi:hypothetical protein